MNRLKKLFSNAHATCPTNESRIMSSQDLFVSTAGGVLLLCGEAVLSTIYAVAFSLRKTMCCYPTGKSPRTRGAFPRTAAFFPWRILVAPSWRQR
jgi:hypothetical protein